MNDEFSMPVDAPHLSEQLNCHDSFRSTLCCSEDYVYQLEYEKRKHLDQIKVLQQQIDLSDKRNYEFSEEIAAVKSLNHRLRDAADENIKLHEAIDELTQSEIVLKKSCNEMRASLADYELKFSLKEQEYKDLENELKAIRMHESFHKNLLLTAKDHFESQQESLECLLEKFEQISCRVIKLENEFNHVRSRILDSKDELELLTQEKESLLSKIKMLEEKSNIYCHFDDTNYNSGENSAQFQISNLEMRDYECKCIREELDFAVNRIPFYSVEEETNEPHREEKQGIQLNVSADPSFFLNLKCIINEERRRIIEYISQQDRIFLFVVLWLAATFLLWISPNILVLPSPLRIYSRPCHDTECDFVISGFANSLLGFRILKFNRIPPT